MLLVLACVVGPIATIGAALAVAGASRRKGKGAVALGSTCAGCTPLSTTGKKKMPLHKIADVPPVMRRAGILTGYRHGLTNAECLWSLITVSNELASQWTHGGPLLWALWALSAECQEYAAGNLTAAELGISAAFFSLIVFCLGSSVLFHTFGCKSADECWRLCHIDHVGVVLGTLAGYFPALYFGFACEPQLQFMYATVTCVTVVTVMSLMASPRWRNDDWLPIRLSAMGSLLILGVIPTTHYIFLHWSSPDLWILAKMIVEAYCILSIGVVFYFTRFPESIFPGLFDLMLYSHMWWHVMVAAGFVSMFNSYTELREYRHTVGCPLSANVTLSNASWLA